MRKIVQEVEKPAGAPAFLSSVLEKKAEMSTAQEKEKQWQIKMSADYRAACAAFLAPIRDALNELADAGVYADWDKPGEPRKIHVRRFKRFAETDTILTFPREWDHREVCGLMEINADSVNGRLDMADGLHYVFRWYTYTSRKFVTKNATEALDFLREELAKLPLKYGG